MCRSKLFINGIFILVLLVTALGNTSTVAKADKKDPNADPNLLQLAIDHPDYVFPVIVQKELKNKDLPDDDPEIAVEKVNGKVNREKKMDFIASFSADLTGKEIEKLAKNPKVRWVSLDAPLFSTALPGFGTTGIVTTNFTIGNDGANGVALQPDGKLVVAGYAYDGSKNVFAVARYNTNGTLDTTFDGDGKVTTAVGSLGDVASAVAIQSDGKIVVVGTSNVGSYQDFAAVRYNANGTLDTTFSGDGKQTTSLSSKIENARAVAIQSDGKIVIVGYANMGTNNDDIALLRYKTDGSLDTTFSGDGKQTTAISSKWEYGQAVVIQSDGKIVVAGQTTTGTGCTNCGDIAVVRYNTNGNLDTTFDGDGKVWTDFNTDGDQAYAVKVQPDGKIVVAGTSQLSGGTPDFALVRYNANGSLDTTFGTSGKVKTAIGASYDTARALALQPDGKIVVAGQSKNATNFDVALLRYTANGTLDAAFDGEGIVTTAIGNADDAGYAVALQSDGKIVVAGDLDTGGYVYDFAVMRFNTDGSLDCSQCIDTGNLVNVYNRTIGADRLWNAPGNLQGQGVTVAVVDSGINAHTDLQVTGGGNSRLVASTTVRPDTPADDYGHGTHVAGVITGNGSANSGARIGVAPGANLVNVKVSDSTGMSLGSDLVAGLQWVYDNRLTYNIKVVNISLNSTVAESYHTSPIDAAVEVLWFNGIVVVVSAGNNGGPGAIYPPANDPFVITVGAADDLGTASLSDDVVAAFSAYGTTENGFAKPDLVAPGRNLISLNASTNSNIYINHATYRVDNNYFRMSGTSMSAPVVTGAVALLLQDEPTLNPDQVKYRLMATANKTWAGYNATTAGAGYLDIYAAVYGTTTQTANTGILASQMLATGSAPITWSSVGWNSVGWNSVGWNSVGWNSVGWNSVGWNSVGWNTDYWGP